MPTTVGDILEGKPGPICVHPEEALPNAVGLMLQHDFSQLPVIEDDGVVLGIISSDLILRALSGFKCVLEELNVRQAMDKAPTLRLEDDVFELLRRLEDSGAVVVVDRGKVIKGILTNYDTTIFFHDYAESLMLVEDIETALRDHILAAFSTKSEEPDVDALDATIESVLVGEERELVGRLRQAIQAYISSSSERDSDIDELAFDQAIDRMIDRGESKSFEELTFSEYQLLLLSDQVWSHYLHSTGLSRDSVRSMLDDARGIRNFLFHFKGQLDKKQREALRLGSTWFANNQPPIAVEIPVATDDELSTIDHPRALHEDPSGYVTIDNQTELIPSEEEIDPDESRYAPLAIWLERSPSSHDKVKLSFNQIEEIISDRLPGSAFNHRSWWANDSVSHVQSKQWLDAGWRVSSVSLTSEHVTFSRIEEHERSRIEFYSRILEKLKQAKDFPLKDTSPSGAPWFVVSRLPESGRQQAILGFSFVRTDRFRVELYIDTGHRDKNKEVFSRLSDRKTEIERGFGAALTWEPMFSKRASRVASYRAGNISLPQAELDEMVHWAVDAVIRLNGAIRDRTEDALGIS